MREVEGKGKITIRREVRCTSRSRWEKYHQQRIQSDLIHPDDWAKKSQLLPQDLPQLGKRDVALKKACLYINGGVADMLKQVEVPTRSAGEHISSR